MTDFYRKVNKFFQEFAKCDPCLTFELYNIIIKEKIIHQNFSCHLDKCILEHFSISFPFRLFRKNTFIPQVDLGFNFRAYVMSCWDCFFILQSCC